MIGCYVRDREESECVSAVRVEVHLSPIDLIKLEENSLIRDVDSSDYRFLVKEHSGVSLAVRRDTSTCSPRRCFFSSPFKHFS